MSTWCGGWPFLPLWRHFLYDLADLPPYSDEDAAFYRFDGKNPRLEGDLALVFAGADLDLIEEEAGR